MKKYFKFRFVNFFVFFIFSILSLTFTVHAETVSVQTLEELQSKINSVMVARQPTFSVSYPGNSTTLKNDVSSVINNIYNSNDYLLYTNKGYTYSYTSTGGLNTINFTFKYWNTTDQDNYVNNKVTEILSQIITNGMSGYEKEKVIHDWIETHVAYDTTLVKHSDYDALVSPYKTVCQGYALLAYRMLNQAGIETKIIEGTAGGQAHVWNLVNLDGAWYHFDATWDDPIPDVADRVTYSYYNLTDAQIKSNHTWVKSYPLATTDFSDTLNAKLISDSSNASTYQSLIDALDLNLLSAQYTVNNAAELNGKIQEAISNNKNEIRVRYMKDSTLAADIQTAVKGISNITSYSYSKTNYIRSSVLGDDILDLTFNYSTPINVSSLSLSNSDLTLSAGATNTLTAAVLPSNASNKTIIWTTSNSNVATVSGGVVKAVGGGTATITAKTADGGYAASCNITIIQGVSGIVITSPSPYVSIGADDITLTATVNPTGATNKSLTWKSSNTAVATVDSNGKVHAVAYGTADIYATSVQDPTKIAKYTVIVPVHTTGVSITSTSNYVKMGSTLPVSAIITPTNATIKTVTWTSSDSSIAKVSNIGIVTPVAAGKVTITATATDGSFTATKDLEVIYGVTTITFDKSSTYLKVGDADITLAATVNPANATYKSLTWKSSNTAVVTVDDTGKVHAVDYGTAVIYATSKQDPTKIARCTVIVPVPTTGVSITSPSNYVKMGSSLSLSAIIAPTNATIKTVTWTSSDSSIAKVSATGIVIPVAAGKVTITATTTDGSFTAAKDLEVIYGVTSITLDKSSAFLKVGNADITLAATVNPTNATYNSLTWKSSNTAVVTVDDTGKVHAVAYGTAAIYATSKQDPTKIARCTIIVPVPVTGVSITSASNYVKMGSSLPLSAIISPTNATIKTVTWTSSDSSMAKVSATGIVTPVATGKVTITATTTDGSFTATKDLEVIYGVTTITLDKSSAYLKVGDADITLASTVNPTNATYNSLTWKSSNTTVATVDDTGKVHAVANGTAVIYATSKQDPTKIARCTVIVTK